MRFCHKILAQENYNHKDYENMLQLKYDLIIRIGIHSQNLLRW
jgi:hypothetical protein